MIIKKILELLKELDKIDTRSFFGHYSSKYVWQKISEMNARRSGWRPKEEIIAEQKDQELKRFYSILYSLKKQGFIRKTKNLNKKSIWMLTKKGSIKLVNLKLEKDNRFPSFEISIEKDYLKLVIFDIPESLKSHREWLRSTLILFGFRMLQKSVWIGENKLPEDFIHTLRNMKLLGYVHILSVKDTGTLV